MSETQASYAITTQPQQGFIAPVVNVQDALARYQAMKEFISGVLKPVVDFGKIPGTSKDTLLKPGAEKLSTFFGLRPVFILVDTVNDWTGKDHDGEPFFFRDYKCQMYRNGELVGEGCGSCNSWETKYRYRKSARKCPKCGAESIIKGKTEYGGGWLCFQKKGGCGAKFADGDKSIEGQDAGQVRNPDIADQVNTIDKMAQKRAFIAAVLITTNASDYFTQDIDDFINHDDVIEGDYSEQGNGNQHQKPSTQKPSPKNPPAPESDRPYSPDTLKERIKVMVDSYAGVTCKENDRVSVRLNLVDMLGDTDKYHTMLKWLTGYAHINDLPDGEVLALKRWIHSTKQGEDWKPDPTSAQEAIQAYDAALVAQGQQKLL